MLETTRNFIADDNAATAIEYGLIATLIAVAMIGGLTAFGGSLTTMWDTTSNTVSGLVG